MNRETTQKIVNTENRYERKFTTSATDVKKVILHIKRNPAFFREIYHPRQINNIYLDTPQLQFYNNNKIGIADRKKVRIRWYGDLQGTVQRPKLEYKLKEGLVGSKIIFDLPTFKLTPNFTKSDLKNIFAKANLPDSILKELNCLVPTLINTYQRQYYISADSFFRLTLDQNLTYYYFNAFRNSLLKKAKEIDAYVIELKYGMDVDAFANKVTNFFPYRLDKKSKYMTGIDFFK